MDADGLQSAKGKDITSNSINIVISQYTGFASYLPERGLSPGDAVLNEHTWHCVLLIWLQWYAPAFIH